jgi:ABC-type nitrate/sulfonate/bicarbonate transport system substrate-binding protein
MTVGIVAGLAAVAGSSSSASGSQSSKTLTNVVVGMGPYYDYQLMQVAHALGLDRQQGLNFKIEQFPSAPLSAVQTGSVDLTWNCDSCYYAIAKNFPTYRNFIDTNQFKGFALVGRRGHVTPYSVYVARYHGNLAAAKRAFVLQQVKGKTVAICPTVCGNLPPLQGLLAQAGLKANAVHLVNFADDGKAADAFLAGTGDFYTGSLPQEARLLYSPEFHGQFVTAAPQQAFGPGVQGGVLYSTFGTSAAWLTAHPTAAKKVVAVWYRAVQYLHDDPAKILPMVTRQVKAAVGGLLPLGVTNAAMTKLNYFPTFNQARTYVFGPGSPTNQLAAAAYQAKTAGVTKQLPGGWQAFEVARQWYNAVAADPTLVRYINAPVP